MTGDLHAIALRLDKVILALPGVATLFATDPTVIRAAKELTSRDGSLALVAVSTGTQPGSLAVVASVGIHDDDQAPITASAIARAVKDALPGREVAVTVRVSRVGRRSGTSGA